MLIAAAPPAEITAGDTIAFAYSAASYPASSGWGMAWRLVGAGVGLDLSAVAAGDGFTVSSSAASTAALVVPVAGIPCQLAGFATIGAERYSAFRAACLLRPNPAGATGDLRGQAARVLAAVDALLEGRASLDQQSYKIGDRELSRIPVPELLQLRDYYLAEARRAAVREARAMGQPVPRRVVLMRMGRA